MDDHRMTKLIGADLLGKREEDKTTVFVYSMYLNMILQ